MQLRSANSFAAGLIAISALISGATRAADQSPCAKRSDLAGPCYRVHGRFFSANGSPSGRIWVIGTKRILGLATPLDAEYSESEAEGIAPANLIGEIRNSGTRIYGDFLVCPFDKDIPGHMRMVCIESAKNMIVEDNEWVDNKNKVTYIRVPN